MSDFLQATNPSETWISRRFQISQEFATGELIVLRFDLPSAGMWTTDKVIERFGDSILADKDKAFGEYLSVASTIADVLNERMMRVRTEILGHARTTFQILDALRSQQWVVAHVLTGQLGIRLLAYEPEASPVWSQWIDLAFETIKSDSGLEFG